MSVTRRQVTPVEHHWYVSLCLCHTETDHWYVCLCLCHTETSYDCCTPSVHGSYVCVSQAHGDRLRLLYTIGYSVSLGSLLIAVVIMLCCK